MTSNVNLDTGPTFVIFLLSGWLTAYKVLAKIVKLVLRGSLVWSHNFIAMLSNKPEFLASGR